MYLTSMFKIWIGMLLIDLKWLAHNTIVILLIIKRQYWFQVKNDTILFKKLPTYSSEVNNNSGVLSISFISCTCICFLVHLLFIYLFIFVKKKIKKRVLVLFCFCFTKFLATNLQLTTLFSYFHIRTHAIPIKSLL